MDSAPDPDPDPMLSTVQAAQMLGVPREAILYLLRRGLLMGTHEANGRWVIPRRAVEQTTMRARRRPNAHLTQATADLIRTRYAAGGTTYRGLAAEYGVSHETVRLIVTGRTWRRG